MRQYPAQKLATTGFATVLACLAGSASAAEWTTSASVTPGVTYTDNVCLSADNTQDEWIGIVTPAGSVTADGNRANLSLNASVEVNTLSDSKLDNLGCTGGSFGNREQFAPQLSGNADAILVENWLYIDGTAFINQNQASPFVSGGNDSLNRTGNTNTTYNYSISPYLSHRFKDAAELNLRYTWDDQYNSTDLVGDSSEQSAQASVSGVPGTAKFSWGIQGDYSKTNYSDNQDINQQNNDSELKSAQLNLGYQLTRAWQVNGFYGDEWNDFVSTRDDIDGEYWDAGIRWTPNARTSVDVGNGHRFFGNSPRFAITHRHKRSALNASYARELTYDRNIRALDDSPPLNPDFPPPPGVNPGVTTNTSSPILDERFTLGYSYQGLHTSLGVSAFQSDQTREGGDSQAAFTESSYSGISVSATRKLSELTSLNAGVNWSKNEPKNSEGSPDNRIIDSSETWTGSLGITRRISRKMNLGLNYEYTDRQSDTVLNEYTENRVTLDLTIDL